MRLKVLSIFEFDEFAKSHPLGTFHQSSSYGMLMSERGYDYEMIGMVDENDTIVAASLILVKKIGLFSKYGYAPKGFLIDYSNTDLLKKFVSLLRNRYYKKNFVFIKINPEISIAHLNSKGKETINDEAKMIEENLISIGFKKLPNNVYFEALFPRFNAALRLKEFDLSKADKRTRNKIRKSMRKGLYLEKGTRDDIDIIYEFVKQKKNVGKLHYYNYYNVFQKTNSVDIFLVKIDFEKALIAAKDSYEMEVEKNAELVQRFIKNNTEENLNLKMESDKVIESIKDDIAYITGCLANANDAYVAGAITIRFKDRVNILISGYDHRFKRFNPNYFLHYKLIEYYKKDFAYIDMNGITGDFSDANPYKGLNEFKFGFNPDAFELIGEFDYVINEGVYKNLDANGYLAKEFDRTLINSPVQEEIKIKEVKEEKPKKPKKSFITITK